MRSAFQYLPLAGRALRRHALKGGKAVLVLILAFGWVFSGWPQFPLTNFPPRIQRAEAAANIAYVGGQAGNSIGVTGNTQVDFSLSGGIDTIPRAGDLVVISFSCSDNSNKTLTIQDAASGGADYIYAGGGDLYQNGTTYDSNFVVGYKRMGVTPDASAFLAGGDGSGGRAWTVHVFRDVDPNSPLDVAAVTIGGTGTHLADSDPILPSTAGTWIYVAGAGATATGADFAAGYLTAFLTTSGADSQDSDVGAGYVTWTSGSYDPAAFTGGGTDGAGDSWNAVTLALRPDQTTEDQEGFAFGDDDGSEAAHTLGTQDSHLTAGLGTKTLRVIVNSTGDKPANAFKLKYQKNGSGGYTDLATTSVTVGQTGAIDAPDVTTDGNNTASTPWGVNVPNAAAGDLIIVNLGWDDNTDVTDVTAPSGQNGETAQVILGPEVSASTAVRAKSWYYIATGSWTAGDLDFTPTASEQWVSTVIVIPAGEFDPTTPIGASNHLESSGTGNPSLPSLTAGASDGRGRVVGWLASDADNADGSVSDWSALSNSDIGAAAGNAWSRDTLASDSESIASASGWTYPTARNWVSFIYIIRPPADVTNDVYISASGNVAAGGEDTTARLTPPSGKTTGDFTTGRRWDDENGDDTIDIANNFYTEVEWILTAQSPASTDDYYEFRVYKSNVAFDTYSVTPKWTIGDGGEPSATVPARSLRLISSRMVIHQGSRVIIHQR